MNVLYFDPKFLTPRHSAPTRAYSLARRLVERGHAVTMVARDLRWLEVTPDAGRARLVGRERVDGIDVMWMRIPYDQSFSKRKRLLSYGAYAAAASVVAASRVRPDVVYASSTPLTVGIPGALTARVKRVPWVFELQDLWPAAPAALGFLEGSKELAAAEWLERTLYASAARIVVCSQEVVDVLAARGIPEEKLVLIPNFAETRLFRPGIRDDDFRAKHGLDGKFVAVYSGAMGVANGVHQLADAAAALKRIGAERVAIVALGSGSERDALERRARAEKLDNLLLLPPVSREEMPGIVGAADATLTVFAPNPVLELNSPNKFFDGLAAGKPVIVNVDGWLRRLVEENGAGAYAPAGDADALARVLTALAEDPDGVARMGDNARQLATREFARDLLADRLSATLEEVAARKP
ncbi:MAG: glycosyltransferase family 4 protein [Actinobacteria bacterium]|nr:glycosyltransferase family 4 protein [Actinomycetota bacterium]